MTGGCSSTVVTYGCSSSPKVSSSTVITCGSRGWSRSPVASTRGGRSPRPPPSRPRPRYPERAPPDRVGVDAYPRDHHRLPLGLDFELKRSPAGVANVVVRQLDRLADAQSDGQNARYSSASRSPKPLPRSTRSGAWPSGRRLCMRRSLRRCRRGRRCIQRRCCSRRRPRTRPRGRHPGRW